MAKKWRTFATASPSFMEYSKRFLLGTKDFPRYLMSSRVAVAFSLRALACKLWTGKWAVDAPQSECRIAQLARPLLPTDHQL
jgi:hypothetical protein